MIRFAFCLLFFVAFQAANAQFYLAENASFFLSDGAIMRFSGPVFLDSLSVLQNDGVLVCDSDLVCEGLFENSGTVEIQGNTTLLGTNLNTPSSDWLFTGSNQQVYSAVLLQFGGLEFSGTGMKQLNSSANCLRLKLQNCKINTQSNALQVEGFLPTDLDANNGWIYSSVGGGFYRNVRAGQEYVFPIGSESTFRPLWLSPFSDGLCGSRFSENSAASEGVSLALMNAGLCSIGSTFHYRLFSNTDSVRIRGVYDSTWIAGKTLWAASTLFPQTQWEVLPTEIEPISDSVQVASILYAPGEWVLSDYKARPTAPVILGPDSLCYGIRPAVYSVQGEPNTAYLWTFSAAGQSTSYGGTTVSVTWNGENNAGISVVASNGDGCSSLPSALSVHFNPIPVAGFEPILSSFPSTEDPIQFINQSQGAIIYNWDFGDGNQESAYNAAHRFELPGVYTIELEVQNEFGCLDSVSRLVEISEDVLLPNVFSPNGDGLNDELEVLSSGLNALTLSIFDRWGNLVFESSQLKLFWDGRNANGQRMPTGTYFAVLKADGQTQQFEKKQSITLFD